MQTEDRYLDFIETHFPDELDEVGFDRMEQILSNSGDVEISTSPIGSNWDVSQAISILANIIQIFEWLRLQLNSDASKAPTKSDFEQQVKIKIKDDKARNILTIEYENILKMYK